MVVDSRVGHNGCDYARAKNGLHSCFWVSHVVAETQAPWDPSTLVISSGIYREMDQKWSNYDSNRYPCGIYQHLKQPLNILYRNTGATYILFFQVFQFVSVRLFSVGSYESLCFYGTSCDVSLFTYNGMVWKSHILYWTVYLPLDLAIFVLNICVVQCCMYLFTIVTFY